MQRCSGCLGFRDIPQIAMLEWIVCVLSALWADFSRPSRAWLSATSPSNPQSRQCELYQGLVPIPVRSSVWRDTAAGTITPTLDLMQFVIDHAVTWVPHLPKHHLPATPRTTERITPRTGPHAITVSLLRHDAIRSLDQPTQCHHQHGEQPLHLLDFARGMQPIITNTMEPFRQNRLYHPPDAGQRRDLFLLPLLGLVIVVPVPHPLPVVAQDAPQGDRGTDDVFRQGIRQPLATRRDLPLFQVGDQAAGILAPQGVDLGFDRARAHPLLHHGAEVILPLLVQDRKGKRVHLPPALLRRHPPRGHEDMQMRVPMPRAPRGLQHYHVACLQLDLREPRQCITQHRDPTLHQVSQERSIAIKLDVQRIGHGQHHVAIRHPLIERPPDVGHPLIDVHLAAGETKAALAAEGHPLLFQAVRAQIRGVARLLRAAAEHLVDHGLHVAILVPRMALLEGPPVIAEDLLEGVFVDPLPCWCHGAWLYHVLAPRSIRLCPPIRLPLPIVSHCSGGQKRGCSKKEILIRSSYRLALVPRADITPTHQLRPPMSAGPASHTARYSGLIDVRRPRRHSGRLWSRRACAGRYGAVHEGIHPFSLPRADEHS